MTDKTLATAAAEAQSRVLPSSRNLLSASARPPALNVSQVAPPPLPNATPAQTNSVKNSPRPSASVGPPPGPPPAQNSPSVSANVRPPPGRPPALNVSQVSPPPLSNATPAQTNSVKNSPGPSASIRLPPARPPAQTNSTQSSPIPSASVRPPPGPPPAQNSPSVSGNGRPPPGRPPALNVSQVSPPPLSNATPAQTNSAQNTPRPSTSIRPPPGRPNSAQDFPIPSASVRPPPGPPPAQNSPSVSGNVRPPPGRPPALNVSQVSPPPLSNATPAQTNSAQNSPRPSTSVRPPPGRPPAQTNSVKSSPRPSTSVRPPPGRPNSAQNLPIPSASVRPPPGPPPAQNSPSVSANVRPPPGRPPALNVSQVSPPPLSNATPAQTNSAQNTPRPSTSIRPPPGRPPAQTNSTQNTPRPSTSVRPPPGRPNSAQNLPIPSASVRPPPGPPPAQNSPSVSANVRPPPGRPPALNVSQVSPPPLSNATPAQTNSAQNTPRPSTSIRPPPGRPPAQTNSTQNTPRPSTSVRPPPGRPNSAQNLPIPSASVRPPPGPPPAQNSPSVSANVRPPPGRPPALNVSQVSPPPLSNATPAQTNSAQNTPRPSTSIRPPPGRPPAQTNSTQNTPRPSTSVRPPPGRPNSAQNLPIPSASVRPPPGPPPAQNSPSVSGNGRPPPGRPPALNVSQVSPPPLSNATPSQTNSAQNSPRPSTSIRPPPGRPPGRPPVLNISQVSSPPLSNATPAQTNSAQNSPRPSTSIRPPPGPPPSIKESPLITTQNASSLSNIAPSPPLPPPRIVQNFRKALAGGQDVIHPTPGKPPPPLLNNNTSNITAAPPRRMNIGPPPGPPPRHITAQKVPQKRATPNNIGPPTKIITGLQLDHTKKEVGSVIEFEQVSSLPWRQLQSSVHYEAMVPNQLDEDREYYWIKDDVLGWCCCALDKHEPDGSVWLVSPDDVKVKVPRLDKLEAVELSDIKNEMANLEQLKSCTEGAVVWQLGRRYAQNEIYTLLGSVLITLCPLPNKTQNVQRLYGVEAAKKAMSSARNARRDPGQRDRLEPHIYSVAAASYLSAVHDAKPQSILVSGEAGSGKTETVRRVLELFSSADSYLLSATSLILEAFGNACTFHNSNSSRFSLWRQVRFEVHSGKMAGCRLEHLLFESSRVTKVFVEQRHETNFHALYATLLRSEKDELRLQPGAKERGYLSADTVIDYDALLRGLDTAFGATGLDQDEEVKPIFRINAGIIQLGEIVFVEDDDGTVRVDDQRPLQWAALLLGLGDVAQLERSLLLSVTAPGDAVQSLPHSCERAVERRDALARALYTELFGWLVERCNRAFRTTYGNPHEDPTLPASTTITVLDPCGFEYYGNKINNGIEQLRINYADERLQHHFNAVVLDGERALYRAEGVPTKLDDHAIAVQVHDNGACLSLLDSIFTAIYGSDSKRMGLIDVVRVAAEQSTLFSSDNASFCIQHYAGPTVHYSITDAWLVEIKGVPAEILAVVRYGTSDPIVKALRFKHLPTKDSKSIESEFEQSLVRLENTLRSTRPRFVRCIRPYDSQQNDDGSISIQFDNKAVLRQSTCAGIFGALRIRKSGYGLRLPLVPFLSRFGACARGGWIWSNNTLNSARMCQSQEKRISMLRIACEKIRSDLIAEQVIATDELAIGKSRVFFRDAISVIAKLEKRRERACLRFALELQSWWRTRLLEIRKFGSKKGRLLAQKHKQEEEARIALAREAQEAAEAARRFAEFKKLEEEKRKKECIAMDVENHISRLVREDGFTAAEAAYMAGIFLAHRLSCAVKIEACIRAFVARHRCHRLRVLRSLRDAVYFKKGHQIAKALAQAQVFSNQAKHGSDAVLRVAVLAVEKRFHQIELWEQLSHDLESIQNAINSDNAVNQDNQVVQRFVIWLSRVNKDINEGRLSRDLVAVDLVNATLEAFEHAAKIDAACHRLRLALTSCAKNELSALDNSEELIAAIDAVVLAETATLSLSSNKKKILEAARRRLENIEPLLNVRHALVRAIEIASPLALRSALERRRPLALIYGESLCASETHLARILLTKLLPTLHLRSSTNNTTLDPSFLHGDASSLPEDAVLPPHLLDVVSKLSSGNQRRSEDQLLLRALEPSATARDNALRLHAWIQPWLMKRQTNKSKPARLKSSRSTLSTLRTHVTHLLQNVNVESNSVIGSTQITKQERRQPNIELPRANTRHAFNDTHATTVDDRNPTSQVQVRPHHKVDKALNDMLTDYRGFAKRHPSKMRQVWR